MTEPPAAGDDPPPPADTKDWTWVIERRCPECDFQPRTGQGVAALRAALPDVPGFWRGRLADPDSRSRPRPEVWSALEYAAHVRDVLEVFDGRFRLLLTADDPEFANWDQDATARERHYAASEPDAVSRQIEQNADQLLATVEGIEPGQQQRTGRRANGSRFTVDSLAIYTLHDLVHHEHDVA